MASGASVMAAWIARLRAVPKAIRAETFAPDVRAELERTIAAGTSPDGTPWKQRKEGGQALQHAAAALTVTPAGSSIICVLTGPEAVHHKGTKKDPKRQVLPEGDLPPAMATRLDEKASETLKQTLGGG